MIMYLLNIKARKSLSSESGAGPKNSLHGYKEATLSEHPAFSMGLIILGMKGMESTFSALNYSINVSYFN